MIASQNTMEHATNATPTITESKSPMAYIPSSFRFHNNPGLVEWSVFTVIFAGGIVMVWSGGQFLVFVGGVFAFVGVVGLLYDFWRTAFGKPYLQIDGEGVHVRLNTSESVPWSKFSDVTIIERHGKHFLMLKVHVKDSVPNPDILIRFKSFVEPIYFEDGLKLPANVFPIPFFDKSIDYNLVLRNAREWVRLANDQGANVNPDVSFKAAPEGSDLQKPQSNLEWDVFEIPDISLPPIRPVSSECPSCGSPDFRSVEALKLMALVGDRECTNCGTAYSIPTPQSTSILFILIGLSLFFLSPILAFYHGPKDGWGYWAFAGVFTTGAGVATVLAGIRELKNQERI